MKKPLLSLVFLFTICIVNAQNIDFLLADPQPDLVQVYAGSFASGDIDGDGDQDLIMSGITPSRETALYLNDGNGNFIEVTDSSLPEAASSVTIFEDLDDDGDLDLFFIGVANGIQEFTHIYLNDGMGNFELLANTALPIFADRGVAIEDVNGDNHPDILFCGKDSNDDFIAELYINGGNANFGLLENNEFIPLQFSSIAFIDVENDGDADVIISGQQDDETALTVLYLNDGSGNFTEDANSNFLQLAADDIDVADTDNDGDLDILISGSTDNFDVHTILYINDGNGDFTELSSAEIQDTFAGTNAIADLDNDGDQDLVIIGSQDGGLPNIFNIVYENLGNNEFVPSDTIGGEYIAACVVEDFNGDGFSDVIIQGFVDQVSVYWNIPDFTSLNEVIKPESLTLFPNPSSGEITITLEDESSIYNLKIYSSLGRLVHEQENISGTNIELQLDLPSGSYIVYLNSENSIFTKDLFIR